METVGKLLKEKRLEKGLILDDVADIIKIRKKYLEAIESGNYGEIPDKVYTKSFLKIYSEFLGLDRVYIVRRYLDEITQEDPIIAPKTYNQHHFGERNYPGEKTTYNRLMYIFAGLLIIAVLVWGVYWILAVKNNRLSKVDENSVNLSDVQSNKTEEIPTTPPVIEIPEQGISPKHSYEKLVIELKTSDKVWVGIQYDKARQESFTLLANTTKSIEATRNISFDIGNAGGLQLIINGFELPKLGNSGETIFLNITLSPGESIQVVTVRGNKSETQILKE
jgi:cytoskeletal protein RodZ